MTHPSSPPAPMTAGRLDQCAWLIECRIGPESTYIQLKSREELSQEWEEEIHARGYDAAKKLKPWHFTKDASSATRFAREEDAARAMVALGMQGPTGLLDWLRPTEHMWSDAAHPDVSNVPALTARVAELERHLATASKNVIEGADETLKCCAEVERLEAELAAARKVEDGEVASYALRLHTIANHALDPSPARDDLHHAADLLTRLSATLKAAERRSLDNAVRAHGWMVQHDTLVGFIQARQSVLNELIDNDPRPASPKPSDVPDIIARAQAAEAKLYAAMDALTFILPLAKGYAHEHPVGANQRHVDEAAETLRALQTKDTTP